MSDLNQLPFAADAPFGVERSSHSDVHEGSSRVQDTFAQVLETLRRRVSLHQITAHQHHKSMGRCAEKGTSKQKISCSV